MKSSRCMSNTQQTGDFHILGVKKWCHPNHGYNSVNSWSICRIPSLLQRALNFQHHIRLLTYNKELTKLRPWLGWRPFLTQCISVTELYMLRTASVQTSRPELLPSQLSTLPDVSWALLLHTTAQMSTRTTEFCTRQLLQGGKLPPVNTSQGVSEWVSSLLMAHQHILGYLMAYIGVKILTQELLKVASDWI